VLQQRLLLPPKGANRIVIGMRVGAQESHRHVLMGAALNLPAGENPGRVAVNQQTQHHRRRILFVARAALVDLRLPQIEFRHCILHEMHKVLCRQQERRIVVDVDEAGCDPRFSQASQTKARLSPTGC
jgi:hypothetical protein